MSSGHNARCDQRFSDMDHLDRHRDQGRHGGCFTDRVVSLSTGTCVTGGTPSGAAGHAAGDISACDSASSRDLGRCGKSASTGTARASTRTTACDFGGLGHLRGPDLGPVGPDGAQRCSRCCSKDAAEGCAGEAHHTTEEQHNGIVCDAHWSAAAAADGTASNVQLVNGQLRRDFIFSERGKVIPGRPGEPSLQRKFDVGNRHEWTELFAQGPRTSRSLPIPPAPPAKAASAVPLPAPAMPPSPPKASATTSGPMVVPGFGMIRPPPRPPFPPPP